MDKNSHYYKQVQLLISVLPYVAKEKCFALKGGTAINLLSHPRPIAEVMSPRLKDIKSSFIQEFNGMTTQVITVDELIAIPEKLITALKTHFTQRDFDFLLSFKSGKPDWELAPDSNIANLPAVKWKLININKMNKDKKAQAVDKLTYVLTPWL